MRQSAAAPENISDNSGPLGEGTSMESLFLQQKIENSNNLTKAINTQIRKTLRPEHIKPDQPSKKNGRSLSKNSAKSIRQKANFREYSDGNDAVRVSDSFL